MLVALTKYNFIKYLFFRKVIMKPKILVKPVMLGVFCFFYLFQAEASAGVDTSGVYPYVEFSNNFPTEGEKITISWILGIHHDACVPKYETSVAQSVGNGVINLYLNYKELKSSKEEVGCLQVLTSYGPRFEVGPLKANFTYKVYIDSPLVREFRVTPNKYPYPIITPHEPHVGDNVSVQWVLGEDSVNCIMQYAERILNTTLMKSNPPIHTITVDYKEAPVDYFACLPRPTLYGPTFDLGIVEAGEYVIYYDTATVAKFTVTPAGNKPVFKVVSERPSEGDTLKVQLILGNGSSSCAPRYVPHFDMSQRPTNTYEYKLTYETIQNTNTICTKDYVPFGPEWTFPNLEAGTHIFWYSENDYYKVFVEKKRQVPDFSYVTIKGTVFDNSLGDKTLEGDICAITVPQCTVMVVLNNIVITKKTGYFIDSIINDNTKNINDTSSLVAPHYTFMAVTDKSGNYTIDSLPASIMINHFYTIAVKNGLIGYGAIPDILREEITSNIGLYRCEAFVDSAKTVFGGSEDIVSLLKQLGIENSSGVKKSDIRKLAQAIIVSVAGGFELVNPERQKINAAVFTIDGKKIWSRNAGALAEGKYFFDIPRVSTGIFLIKIRGEKFEQTKMITIK
jgi:hypothetical protein